MATTSHTKAWKAFEQNLDSIAHMVALVSRENAVLKTKSIRHASYMNPVITEVAWLKLSMGKSPERLLPPLKTELAKLLRSSERYKRTRQTGRDRLGTATLWLVVMLVTCVEAYLQDLLAIAASADRTLMADPQRLVSCADVISATSLDELVSGMCTQWAREWLRKGNRRPTSWISRLKNMGARGYPNDLARRLERIWGIRHVVVHAAGVATANSVKRYPGVVAAAGDRVQVGLKDFGEFFNSTNAFLEPTERFFVKRYPSLVAETVKRSE
jgi:hypothetical protein